MESSKAGVELRAERAAAAAAASSASAAEAAAAADAAKSATASERATADGRQRLEHNMQRMSVMCEDFERRAKFMRGLLERMHEVIDSHTSSGMGAGRGKGGGWSRRR